VRLGEFLTPALAVVPLRAATLGDAAAVLAARLTDAGVLTDAGRLEGRIAEDRAEDTVALTDRAFVLHYRTDAARGVGVALGTSAEPIRRQLRDGEAVHARVVVVVVAPPRLAARYLQIVGGVVRTLSQPELVERMLAQPDAEGLVTVRGFADLELQARGRRRAATGRAARGPRPTPGLTQLRGPRQPGKQGGRAER
jgi:mannitol/fructose-specific phosphotransferase system IIA component (Ntr-type)